MACMEEENEGGNCRPEETVVGIAAADAALEEA